MPVERVIEVDAQTEAIVTWTGSEFACSLRKSSETSSSGEDSVAPQPTDVWVVGTKLYANTVI